MRRRNRVDPWGDLHAVADRGLYTGNRGCLVDDAGRLTRHHNGSLWIICEPRFRDWKHPLDAPSTWTPLFFLDDAVALAAGHRPCGLCRRSDYLAYRDAVSLATASPEPMLAVEMNQRLAAQRHRRGRGLVRAQDRILWIETLAELPAGTVVIESETRTPHLVADGHLQAFSFGGWGQPQKWPQSVAMEVLTPALSVAALRNGYVPSLHSTAVGDQPKGDRRVAAAVGRLG